jgi:hypothetical protein
VPVTLRSSVRMRHRRAEVASAPASVTADQASVHSLTSSGNGPDVVLRGTSSAPEVSPRAVPQPPAASIAGGTGRAAYRHGDRRTRWRAVEVDQCVTRAVGLIAPGVPVRAGRRVPVGLVGVDVHVVLVAARVIDAGRSRAPRRRGLGGRSRSPVPLHHMDRCRCRSGLRSRCRRGRAHLRGRLVVVVPGMYMPGMVRSFGRCDGRRGYRHRGRRRRPPGC